MDVVYEPDCAPTGHTTYYYISDANGTAWGLTDSSGTVVWSADYDSYGNATFAGTIDQPLRMPGQYHDTESGLYYNLARYYEPTTGRYLSVDPLRDAEDYTYAGGNPLKYVDPTGEANLAGFVFSATLDLTIQLATKGGDLRNVDWSDVLISGIAGTVGVGIATKIDALAKLGILSKIGLQGLASSGIAGSSSALKDYLNFGCVNEAKAKSAAFLGGILGIGTNSLKAIIDKIGIIAQKMDYNAARSSVSAGFVNSRTMYSPLTPIKPSTLANDISNSGGAVADIMQELVPYAWEQ